MSKQAASSEQRRRFSRVLFDASAQLCLDSDDLACEVRDLSLKGALLRLTTPAAGSAVLTPGTPCALELRLGDAEDVIRMAGTIAHIEGSCVGVRCQSIDLDSVSHLRRLVELNVGDDAVLLRELSALASLP